jgi:hypothetical protein
VLEGSTFECAVLALVRIAGGEQTATEVAGMTDEGAVLASVRLVGEGSANHCVGWYSI